MDTDKMLIRPAPGRRVKDPRTMAVLRGPLEVPRTTYWLRLIQDGDVLLVQSADKRDPEEDDDLHDDPREGDD